MAITNGDTSEIAFGFKRLPPEKYSTAKRAELAAAAKALAARANNEHMLNTDKLGGAYTRKTASFKTAQAERAAMALAACASAEAESISMAAALNATWAPRTFEYIQTAKGATQGGW
jgi:hypothetical protein